MNFDELENYQRGVVESEAQAMGVDPYALWECYLETMESNFQQDIHDIAMENEEYLKERGFVCE